jgi:hypothetical protein
MPNPILSSEKAASGSKAVAGTVQRTSSPPSNETGWDDWLDTDEHADSDADPD